MNDFGLLHHFLGIEIYQDDHGVFFQKKYTKNIFEEV